MLIKVMARDGGREEVKRMAEIFRGRIIDVTDTTYVIELTGTGEKLDAFIEALDKSLILEVVRTGVSGIARGTRALSLSMPSITRPAPAAKTDAKPAKTTQVPVNPDHLL